MNVKRCARTPASTHAHTYRGNLEQKAILVCRQHECKEFDHLKKRNKKEKKRKRKNVYIYIYIYI
jgi:hypothetical protein